MRNTNKKHANQQNITSNTKTKKTQASLVDTNVGRESGFVISNLRTVCGDFVLNKKNWHAWRAPKHGDGPIDITDRLKLTYGRYQSHEFQN